MSPVVRIRQLDFRYDADAPAPVLEGLDLTLERGTRCLLVGANGAGKTTLLRLIGGKHMIAPQAVRVLGRPAFEDTGLVAQVTFLGGQFPFHLDVRVSEILGGITADRVRLGRLIEILGVDPGWRMCRVSDGQRRRVQLLLGLLAPAEVLLLDEITTDLDLIARADLLGFLRHETLTRGATIIYATHILDRLEEWATHVAWLDEGRIRRFEPLSALTELDDLRRQGAGSPLTHLVERWLRG